MNKTEAAIAAPASQELKHFITTVRRVTYTDYLIEAIDEDDAEQQFWNDEYVELGDETMDMEFEHREVTSTEALDAQKGAAQ